MNGRCTADALDHADDICEFCGDEFCRSCLIQTRGGKGQQICRDCAIRNSGVRGAKSNKARPSKAQIQKAREVLEAAKGTRRAKAFQYFDEEDDYRADEPAVEHAESIDEPIERGGKRRFNLRRKDDARSNDVAPAPSPAAAKSSEIADGPADLPAPAPLAAGASGRSTPATTLIESGALASTPMGDLHPPEEAVESTSTSHPGEDTSGSELATTANGLETDGVSPSQPASEASVDPTSVSSNVTAGSLADRLRSRPPKQQVAAETFPPAARGAHSAPISSQPASAEPPPALQLEADPFAEAGIDAAPSASPEFDVSFASSPSHDPSVAPTAAFEWQTAPDSSPDDLGADPFGEGDPFSAPQDVTRPLPAAPPPPDRTRHDPVMPVATDDVGQPESPAQFVPVSNEVSEYQAERSTMPVDVMQPVIPIATQEHATSVATRPKAPAATQPQPASSADTDANGNWIPPLLRGMAPVAERKAAPLPKRRDSD